MHMPLNTLPYKVPFPDYPVWYIVEPTLIG